MNPKKITNDKMVTSRKSVHVVFFSCAHCGDEVEDIKVCPECGETMRVIDVVEKFGEDAEKFLEKIKKNTISTKAEEEEEDYAGIPDEEPNIILMGGDTDLLVDDGGLDPSTTDDTGLDIIFPDDSEDSGVKTEVLEDTELAKALEQLDSEEEDVNAEDFGFDDENIPEL